MRIVRPAASTLLVTLLLAVPALLLAQGLTAAAISGRVTGRGGALVDSAIVILTQIETGTTWTASTRAGGRYNFENVAPGGPYRIDLRAPGFPAATRGGILVHVGQRYTANFELEAGSPAIDESRSSAHSRQLLNESRSGPEQIIADPMLRRLPLLGRSFTDLFRVSSHVGGGASIGGQNGRFTSMLIDGVTAHDVFGLTAATTPGGFAGAKLLSLEAMREVGILVAPFDVRHGRFSGGLISAVTRSGTNDLRGAGFGYLQRQSLVGSDTSGAEIAPFSITQFGAAVGGPLLRNRLHFFVSADLQRSTTPFIGLSASEPTTGISAATAERVRNILQDSHGFDPGGADAPDDLRQPDRNLFGKLSWQLEANSHLEASFNHVRATQESLNRTIRNFSTRDGWQLANSGYQLGSSVNAARARYAGIFGGKNLEVLLGYQRIRDAREIANRAPLIMVQGDVPGNYVAAGGERFSQGNELDQDLLEATANLTFDVGSRHRITMGLHHELFRFRNLLGDNRYGTWTFGSADSLELELPRRYEILLEARPDAFTGRFTAQQLGGYVQDAWQVADRLTVTAGFRVDVPFVDSPVHNPNPALTDTLGVDTGQFPSGNRLLSPRLSFNWNARGNRATIVRGGVGLFSGRPSYSWISNAFTNTGIEQVNVVCGLNNLIPPPFTADVDNMPRSCLGVSTPPLTPATVVYFDDEFKHQQSFKVALGVDHRLPWGIAASVDFVHTRVRHQTYVVDENVVPGVINGEGRRVYGIKNPSLPGLLRLVQVRSVRQVIRHLNTSVDRSTFMSVLAQKSFTDGLGMTVGYTYSKAKDLMSLTSSNAVLNLRNTPVDGSLARRNLRTSGFDVPHRLAVSATADLPLGVEASLIATARSGQPFAYVVNNDANGDGITLNDLLYVPRSAADITLANPADWGRLDAFIEGQECLRTQRGRVMERNSCRNPWIKFVDLRLAKAVPTTRGQSLLVTADVFNLLNLLNGSWGINRETSAVEQLGLLTFVDYDVRQTADETDDRGVYLLPNTLPFERRAIVNSSRWRIQLGAKYVF